MDNNGDIRYFKSIGVIGSLGMVGGTVKRHFQKEGYEVNGYDIRGEDSGEEKAEAAYSADIIFVCVPTPFRWGDNGGYDDGLVDKVLQLIPDGKVVVIKSTVQIGTTNRLQDKYPKLKLLFNPEFLSEATCDADFNHPDRQFVGWTHQSYDVATAVLNTLPLSPGGFIMPAKEAELLKYINNFHGALEIMESNHYWEVCQEEGLNYDRVLKAMLSSKWVGVPMGRHYRVIHHKGKRGYGGKCFPKDVNSWIQYIQSKGLDSSLPEAVRSMNQRILKEQGYTEEQAEGLG